MACSCITKLAPVNGFAGSFFKHPGAPVQQPENTAIPWRHGESRFSGYRTSLPEAGVIEW